MKGQNTIPVTYSVDDSFDNDKFLKLRLRVCHDARSLNNTRFLTSALENAKESSANIPILAHIFENDDGELEIGEHDFVIEEDRYNPDKYRQIFLEQPVGVVPENNNYEVVEEDGINYVYLDAYIWKGYSNYCIDILKNSERIKLSMEVDFFDYKYSRSEKCYLINDYRYTAITLLGGDNRPAMQHSGGTIVNYCAADDKLGVVTVEEICSEISKVFSSNKDEKKGEDEMNSETIQAILDEYDVTRGELDFEITDNMSEADLKAKIKDYLDRKSADMEEEANKAEKNSVEETVNEVAPAADYSEKAEGDSDSDSAEEPVAESIAEKYYSADSHTIKFSMSDEDKRVAIYNALLDATDDEYWILQTYENYVIAQSWMDGKFYKIGYTKTENAVSIDKNFTEVFSEFVTAEEKAELDTMRSNYSALESEVNDLKQFKADTEAEQRKAALEGVFSKFDEALAESEDYKALKESNGDYSVDEIEEKCYAMIGRMNSNFSEKEEEGVVRVGFSAHFDNEVNPKDKKPYGGLFEVFGKK